jgi:phosphoribosylformimino-5-aminoimidazole carboxamide ribotide isomerase
MDQPFIIFPAIDLRQGQVVRLKEGDPLRQTHYSAQPEVMAQRWLDAGSGWLHVVNLDGAFGESGQVNLAALQLIIREAQKKGAKVQFGGGLRDLQAVDSVLQSGVERAVIGTLAVENLPLFQSILNKWGPDRIAVSLDARDGIVQLRGWQQASQVNAVDVAVQLQQMGLRWLVFTDIARDGLQTGFNLQATRDLTAASHLKVIASGGVRGEEDALAAHKAGLAGMIIGRALYEGAIDLQALLLKMKG